MKEKVETQERFQKLKRFYSNKINSWPKKLSFWVLIVVFFIFLLPLCIGGALTYIFLKVKTEYAWIKIGLIILVPITVIITVGIEVSWTKTLLGMNTSPDLVISTPETETIKVIKGMYIIEVSGKVKPRGSAIEINGDKVEVTEDGSFMKEVSIIKGKNEIKVVGKHGSGTTEKTIIVYRELTEKEFAEEKRIEEERKARAEEERIAREEVRKKAEEEAQASEKADFRITAEEVYSNYVKCQKDFSFEDIIQKKYNGKIVEISGIVEKTMDFYKDTLAAKHGIDASKYIDESKRYMVCLADNEGHACVAWVYSASSQLIDKIKKGDKINVIGRWEDSLGGIPDLMNSKIKNK